MVEKNISQTLENSDTSDFSIIKNMQQEVKDLKVNVEVREMSFDAVLEKYNDGLMLSEHQVSFIKKLKNSFPGDISVINSEKKSINAMLQICKNMDIIIRYPEVQTDLRAIYFQNFNPSDAKSEPWFNSPIENLKKDFVATKLLDKNAVRNIIKKYDTKISDYKPYDYTELVEIDSLMYRLGIDNKTQNNTIKEKIAERGVLLDTPGAKDTGNLFLKQLLEYSNNKTIKNRSLILREFFGWDITIAKRNELIQLKSAWQWFIYSEATQEEIDKAKEELFQAWILSNISLKIAERLLPMDEKTEAEMSAKDLADKVESIMQSDPKIVGIQKFITTLILSQKKKDQVLLEDIVDTYISTSKGSLLKENIELYILFRWLELTGAGSKKHQEKSYDDLWDAVKSGKYNQYDTIFRDMFSQYKLRELKTDQEKNYTE